MTTTALPYIDGEMTPAVASEVDALVQAEMGRFTPPDYLSSRLPAVPDFSFAGSAFLRAEYERVSKGQAMEAMDVSRYELSAPSGDLSESAWAAAVSNAKSQIEHERNRATNLELLNKFGPNTWKLHSSDLDGLKSGINDGVGRLESKAAAVNASRKLSQVDMAPRLAKLAYRWHDLVRKNRDIEVACEQLEANKRLKA